MHSDNERKFAIRSFIIVLYDRNYKQRGYFSLPISVSAPFGNRLFREMLSNKERKVQEPWYSLTPRWSNETSLQRNEKPVGPTSLYGERYVPEEEPPPRVNLHPETKLLHFTVRLFDLQKQLFEGNYTVDDVFLAGAEFLARRQIERGEMQINEGPFYYEVIPSPDEVRSISSDLFPPEAYQVEGVFELPLLAEDRKRIQFRKVPEFPLPEQDPENYGDTQNCGRGKPGDGRIIIHANVYKALREEIFLKPDVEDGGYILGMPYRQPGSSEDESDSEFHWLIEVTDVIQAEEAWGRAALLLFTGGTWSNVSRRIDKDFPGKKLVGWFHTHLFKATDEFGLSGLDHDLHRRFLTKPWQVAVLINIDSDGKREIRCFQRGAEGDLVECTFQVFGATPDEDSS